MTARLHRRLLIAVACPTLTIALTGCWDTQELETRAFVTAIGIDLPEEAARLPDQAEDSNQQVGQQGSAGQELDGGQGQQRRDGSRQFQERTDQGKLLTLTFSIVSPRQLARSGDGGAPGGQDSSFFLVGASGHTLLEAVETAKQRLSRQMFFGHMRLIVISEGVAKERFGPLFEELMRNPDVDKQAFLAVAQGQAAREVLQAVPQPDLMASGFVEAFLSKKDTPSMVNVTRLWEFYRDLREPGREAGAMAIQASDNQVRLYGSALFRGARMVGWLGPHETIGLNFLTNNVHRFTLIVSAGKPDTFIVARDVRGIADVQPMIRPGRPAFRIAIQAEGDLGRKDPSGFRSAPTDFSDAERLLAEAIKRDALAALKKMQEAGADVADFGNKMHLAFPAQWNAHGWDRRWNEVFQEAEMQVEVTVRLRRKGLTQ